ncbi:RNA signal recognition particle 4-5S RNA [Sphingomonas antarctica]|uniref:DUF1428 domain-containing protein n=1 Tax=Sphingomonas antarctica TaxID=2040274 RepID=UPI0039E7C66B
MTYISGFVAAVPTARRDEYFEFAKRVDAVMVEHGATRVVDGWAADVPRGTTTDFYRAVAAEDGEEVVFGWMEWPDKAALDAGMGAAMKDERMSGAPPFDGKRMIYGSFLPVVERRFKDGEPGYIDAFIAPVSAAKKDAFITMSEDGATAFGAQGALFDLECWGEDVPHGSTTDFYRATKAEGDEMPGLSFVGWPDKATRDAGWAEMMKEPGPAEMPFDGKRMFFGGFSVVSDIKK